MFSSPEEILKPVPKTAIDGISFVIEYTRADEPKVWIIDHAFGKVSWAGGMRTSTLYELLRVVPEITFVSMHDYLDIKYAKVRTDTESAFYVDEERDAKGQLEKILDMNKEMSRIEYNSLITAEGYDEGKPGSYFKYASPKFLVRQAKKGGKVMTKTAHVEEARAWIAENGCNRFFPSEAYVIEEIKAQPKAA
jgi:hypothetical protein